MNHRPSIRDKVWQRLVVQQTGLLPQPWFAAVNGIQIIRPDGGVADLADTLAHSPGSYILKPRFGSNGFCVVRIVSDVDGSLTVESDCPDTANYLEEFPTDTKQRGRDLVAAAALHRSRFVDRARVGMSEASLTLSILEAEIPQHRAEGSLFEPRIVVQRVEKGPGRTSPFSARFASESTRQSGRRLCGTFGKNRWMSRCCVSSVSESQWTI